jgi:hypothetical protein
LIKQKVNSSFYILEIQSKNPTFRIVSTADQTAFIKQSINVMTRRDAIRTIALASTATIFFTGCSDRVVTDMLVENQLLLDERHMQYLAKIGNTFLPLEGVSDTMGAPLEFMLTMLNDCHSPHEISDFAEGFEQYKQLMDKSKLSIQKSSAEKIIEAVESTLEAEVPQPELVHFISTVRDLSIRFLKSSEHYMEKYLDFEMIPEIYDPCLTI